MKTKIAIDKDEVMRLVALHRQSSKNMSDLCNKVSEDYKKCKVSSATIRNRLDSWGFVFSDKTKSVSLPETKQLSRESYFENLKRVTPKKFHKLVDRYENGSRSAAIKLKCLDCSGYDTGEIKRCEVTLCSLWNIRPYRGKKKATEVTPTPTSILDLFN